MPRGESETESGKLPFFQHRNGRWCKKVRGRHVYFEKISDDPDGAFSLRLWSEQKKQLLSFSVTNKKAWVFQDHRQKQKLGDACPWSVRYADDGRYRSRVIGSLELANEEAARIRCESVVSISTVMMESRRLAIRGIYEWPMAYSVKSLPEKPGVYCLCSGHHNVLYVGMARNIASRWNSHVHGTLFRSGNAFIAYHVEKDPRRLEGWLITTIDPPLNRQFLNCFKSKSRINGASQHQDDSSVALDLQS